MDSFFESFTGMSTFIPMIGENLFGMTLTELRDIVAEAGMEAYRANQIFTWLYDKHVTDFNEMTNLSKAQRDILAARYSLYVPVIVSERVSTDGTRKFLLALEDKLEIEAVYIPSERESAGEPKRHTICVSTQVGCPLDCVFCATASMKLKRNLTTGEILGQWLALQRYASRRITNLVFMGMGEPLLNLDNVLRAVEILTHEMTTGIGSRHLTISTAGLPREIRRLADSGVNVKLAVSLHSLDDAVRSRLMPINRKHNLADLLPSLEYYYRKTRKRITFEYILFEGLNDSERDAVRLAKLTRRIPGKVNIIPFHQIDHVSKTLRAMDFAPSAPDRAEAFISRLRKDNVTVMVRNSSGVDIDAACGQLAINSSRRHVHNHSIVA